MKNLSRIQLEIIADCILAKISDMSNAKNTVLKQETRDAIYKEINNLHDILDIVCDTAAGIPY